MTKPYWDRFARNAISLQYHWGFLKARLKANLIDPPLSRRWMSAIFILLTIVLVTATNTWTTFMVAWVFPLTILYHISALCQFSSEHIWGSSSGDNSTKSHARFCCEDPPLNDDWKEWTYWWLKIFFYYLPVRVAILPSEMIAHDIHHSHPKEDKEDWANPIYNRQRLVDRGVVKSVEYWGLHNAIDAVFQNLAKQEPLSEEVVGRVINNQPITGSDCSQQQ